MAHFVIEVQGDFLGGDDGLHADIHITIGSDREIAGHGELIASGGSDLAGVDGGRISRNRHRLFLHLLVAHFVVEVQGDFLVGGRQFRFQIIRLAVVIAVLSPDGIQGGILVDAIGLIRIDDTCGVLCIQTLDEIIFRLAEAKKNRTVSGKGNAIANRNRVVL